MLNLEKVIEKIIRIILPTVFFVPLIIDSDFYFPFITPRNFLFRIIVTVVVALYVFLLVKNKDKYKPVADKVLYSYVALIGILTISSLINGDFLWSFWSNYERMDGLITAYFVLSLLLVILGVYYRQKRWVFLLRVASFVSFIVSFIALAQYFGFGFLSDGSHRTPALFGNPAYLGTYALFHFLFSTWLVLKYNKLRLGFELVAFYVLDVIVLFSFVKNILSNFGDIHSLFTNFVLLAFFILPQVFLHINFYLKDKHKDIKYRSARFYFVLLSLMNLLAIFFSAIRGAMIGLAVGIFATMLFLAFSRYLDKKYKKIFVALFAVGIILFSLIFVFKDSSLVQNVEGLRRLSKISLSDTTTQSRLLTWQASMKGAAEKPILGWGQENYYVVFNKYFPKDIFKEIDSRAWFDRPHNIFIQYLVYGGILGLAAYLAIFFFLFKNLLKYLKRTNDLKAFFVLSTLAIAYLIQNFFVFDSINSYIPMALLLAISIFIVQDKRPQPKNITPKENKNLIQAVLAFCLVIFVGYLLTIPRAQANQNMFKSLNEMRYKDYLSFSEASHQKYLDTINKNFLGRYEGLQLYTQYLENLVVQENITIMEKRKAISWAEDNYSPVLEAHPTRVRMATFLVNLYKKAGIFDPTYSQKGVDLLNKIIPYSQERTTLYYALGNLYIGAGDYQKSLAAFEQARELSPNIFESYYYLTFIFLQQSDIDSAWNIKDQMDDNLSRYYLDFYNGNKNHVAKRTYANYHHLADLYFSYSYVPRAASILEELLEYFPNDAETIAKLSLYYHMSGNEEESLKYLEALRQIDKDAADIFEMQYLK